MSLDPIFRCSVTGRELPPFGSFVPEEGRRICDCHREQVTPDTRDVSHTFHTSEVGITEEHITRGEA